MYKRQNLGSADLARNGLDCQRDFLAGSTREFPRLIFPGVRGVGLPGRLRTNRPAAGAASSDAIALVEEVREDVVAEGPPLKAMVPLVAAGPVVPVVGIDEGSTAGVIVVDALATEAASNGAAVADGPPLKVMAPADAEGPIVSAVGMGVGLCPAISLSKEKLSCLLYTSPSPRD